MPRFALVRISIRSVIIFNKSLFAKHHQHLICVLRAVSSFSLCDCNWNSSPAFSSSVVSYSWAEYYADGYFVEYTTHLQLKCVPQCLHSASVDEKSWNRRALARLWRIPDKLLIVIKPFESSIPFPSTHLLWMAQLPFVIARISYLLHRMFGMHSAVLV